MTDGKRLLRIERLTTVGIDAEDAMKPDEIVSIPRTIVERDWQRVVATPKRRPKVKA